MNTADQKPDGFVKLYRSIEDCAAFRSVPEMMAFAWMVMRASWRKKMVRYKGKNIHLKRGELAISTRDFAAAWEWSEAKVRRYLTRLKADAMINARSDAGVNIITICKYNDYQKNNVDSDAPSDAPRDAAATQQRRSSDAQNNEGKKDIDYIPSSVSTTSLFPETESTTSPMSDSASAKSNGYSEDFELFWKTYRRKNDNKQSAWRSWQKAIKQASPRQIITKAEQYIASLDPDKRHGSYQAMASTWLNQARFNDDFEPYRKPQSHTGYMPAENEGGGFAC